MSSGGLSQRVEIKGSKVCHGVGFHVTPYILDRIEFRGIRRKEESVEIRGFSDKGLNVTCSVG